LYGPLAHAPSQYFPCPAPATLAERALSLIFIGPNPNPNQKEGSQKKAKLGNKKWFGTLFGR
jgi:hypothetical protein